MSLKLDPILITVTSGERTNERAMGKLIFLEGQEFFNSEQSSYVNCRLRLIGKGQAKDFNGLKSQSAKLLFRGEGLLRVKVESTITELKIHQDVGNTIVAELDFLLNKVNMQKYTFIELFLRA